MQELKKALKKQPIIYVTRDLERALALAGEDNFYIVTNNTVFAKRLSRKKQNIILVKDRKILSTSELLEKRKTLELIGKLKNPALMVFKNTTQIEKFCKERKIKLLNPSAELAAQIENKISQIDWLKNNRKFLPPHEVLQGKDLVWNGEKFIVQFNHSHSGTGTILVSSQSEVDQIASNFPNRPLRKLEYIEGPTLTCNVVIWKKNLFTCPVSYQITGLQPFTSNPFTTIGNDWDLPHKILNQKQQRSFDKIVQSIGKTMARSGWKGLFGIDVVLCQKSGRLYLIEVNARQPASATFESELQKLTREKNSLTTFEAHILALSDYRHLNKKIVQRIEGAQIIKKYNGETKSKIIRYEKKLKKLPLQVVKYENTAPQSDLLRIQSKTGIMEDHSKPNNLGNEIAKSVK